MSAVDFDANEMGMLIRALVRVAEARLVIEGFQINSPPTLKYEWGFSELIQICTRHRPSLFAWLMAGGTWKIDAAGQPELLLTQTSKSALGKLFVSSVSKIYHLPDGRHVRFGYRGRNRHRRYMIEVFTE